MSSITIVQRAAVVFPIIEVTNAKGTRIVSHCPTCDAQISAKRESVDSFVARAVEHLGGHPEWKGIEWTRATVVTDLSAPQRNRVKLEAPSRA